MKDYFEVDLSDIKISKAYDIDDMPWVISRYVFEGGYILREGDLLKLGKFILKIRQIRLRVKQKTAYEMAQPMKVSIRRKDRRVGFV